MRVKIIAILCFVLISLVVGLRIAKLGPDRANSTYSQFLQRVREGQVVAVIIEAGRSGVSHATGRLKDGSVLRVVLPADDRDAIAAMRNTPADIEIRDASSGWLPLLGNAAPFFVLLALWIFMMLQRMRNGTRPGTSG